MLSQRIQRLPHEVVDQIIEHAGARVCIALRNEVAFRRVLASYSLYRNADAAYERNMTDWCLQERPAWIRGIELLVEHDICDIFCWDPQAARKLEDVVLSPAVFRRGAWRHWGVSTTFASLLLNLARHGSEADSSSTLRWCAGVCSNIQLPVAEACIERGGTLDELRRLHEHMQKYVDDRTLAGQYNHYAATYGRLDLLQQFMPLITEPVPLLKTAVVSGRLDVVQALYELSPPTPEEASMAVARAISHKHMHIAYWLLERHPIPSFDALSAAAATNQLDLLQRFYADGHFSASMAPEMMGAATCGNALDVMRWLYEIDPTCITSDTAEQAAGDDHIEALQLIYELVGDSIQYGMSSWSSGSQYTDVIKWLCNTCPSPERAWELSIAQYLENWDLVAWLMDNFDCSLQRLNIHHVASSGRVDLLARIHAKQPFTSAKDIAQGAVRSGSMDLVRWMHGLFPDTAYDASLALLAAKYNHMETLRWVLPRVTGARQPRDSIGSLFHHARPRTVRWLLEHTDWEVTDDTIMNAASSDQLELLQLLHAKNPVPWPPDLLDWAASCGAADVVEWVHNNCAVECTTAAMDDAAARGQFQVLQFLHTHRTEGCTPAALTRAAHAGHLYIVKWLLEHRRQDVGSALADLPLDTLPLHIQPWIAERQAALSL
ncbi:hypothetical protein RI367_001576 [Sorochytrium milnesiophthora]